MVIHETVPTATVVTEQVAANSASFFNSAQRKKSLCVRMTNWFRWGKAVAANDDEHDVLLENRASGM